MGQLVIDATALPVVADLGKTLAVYPAGRWTAYDGRLKLGGRKITGQHLAPG